MKELSKEMEKLAKGYSKYIYKNEDQLIDDFCNKIKEQKIGNLDLDTYSQFRFWKRETEDHLKGFYKDFKEETKDDKIPFDDFCEFIWLQMEDFIDEMPDDVSSLFKELNSRDDIARA